MKVLQNNRQKGIVLITVLLLMVLLLMLVAAYHTVSSVELATTRFSQRNTTGFYTSEAGLNLRAEEIRQIFVGYNRPTGTSPTEPNSCTGSNLGTGDYVCKTYALGTQSAKTYVTEEAGNPLIITIPQGELYQGLNAQEYRYTNTSFGLDKQSNVESLLELRFKSRLVPLFQFAAFYDKDLEILPGPTMTLSGPVFTNKDLYMDSGATLTINGQTSAAGNIYRGRKDTTACRSNSVGIYDPTSSRNLVPTCSTRTLVASNSVSAWNGMIRIGVSPVSVPPIGSLDPVSTSIYWSNADLRLVLRLDSSDNPVTTYSSTGVEVRNSANTVDTTASTTLAACSGLINGSKAVGSTPNNTMASSNVTYPRLFNARENKDIRMLDIDFIALLNCLKTNTSIIGGKALNDTTDGGIVLYATLEGPNSSSSGNRYGVRIRNAATLQSTISGAPVVKAVTIATDQAAYVYGNFNSGTWVPAAVLSDSINILSGAWTDGCKTSRTSSSCATPTNTTIYSAFLSGTDSTGGVDGTGGQGGAYNGGLENYPRFHENWSGRTVTYRGSFVSLNKPQHVNGAWVYGYGAGAYYYNAPTRDWNYDTRFNDAANLPPLTPRFVYLRQELFVRDYEQS